MGLLFQFPGCTATAQSAQTILKAEKKFFLWQSLKEKFLKAVPNQQQQQKKPSATWVASKLNSFFLLFEHLAIEWNRQLLESRFFVVRVQYAIITIIFFF